MATAPVTKDEVYSVKGTTITLGTTNLAFRYAEIKLPSMEGASIDLTPIDATDFYVELKEQLIRVGALEFTAYLDADIVFTTAKGTVMNLNQEVTVQLPPNPLASAGGELTVWGAVGQLDPEPMALENGKGYQVSGRIDISNLNAALTETGPAYVAATT